MSFSCFRKLSMIIADFKESYKSGIAQYNETRAKAEQHIENKSRLTKHKIKL